MNETSVEMHADTQTAIQNTLQEFVFDANTFVTAKITATSETEARKLLRDFFSCTEDMAVGHANGETVWGRFSLDDGEPDLVETRAHADTQP